MDTVSNTRLDLCENIIRDTVPCKPKETNSNVNQISNPIFQQIHSGNKYSIAAWNCNGWYSKEHPENTKFKHDVISLLKHDIYLISETFCKSDDTILVEGYKCFQYNRKSISKRSIRGSGGVAILINNKLLINHSVVSVMKGNQDGILGLKIKHNHNNFTIGLIANYLPPDSFHYGKDPENYFIDNSVMYDELSDCDLLACGGDLNSRTKEMQDFIQDIDGSNFSLRKNPDKERNSHGDFFIQFLKDKRSLICNGRVTPEFNDFTFINPRGRSVPDYVYCPADHIQYCKSAKVLKISSIINDFKLPVPRSIPDHSIVSCEFDISCTPYNTASDPLITETITSNKKTRKNIRKINQTFMSSDEIMFKVKETISKLENSTKNQTEIDSIYNEVMDIFTSEIDKLPNMPNPQSKKGKQTLRKASPFWNDELQNLWENRCKFENIYTSYKCNSSNHDRCTKRKLQNNFQLSQNAFDKAYRKVKRQFKNKPFHSLAQLSEEASSNPAEIWKQLKALSEPKTKSEITEMIREDGSLSDNVKEILTHWHKEFSECFSGLRDNLDLAYDDNFLTHINNLKTQFNDLSPEQQQEFSSFDTKSINSEITLEEVDHAIKKAKLGKAFLLIPNEALKNTQAKNLLHKLFNICFISGITPLEWSKSDIKPVPKPDKDQHVPLQNRPI